MEKISHANNSKKKAGVVTLIPDKIDIKSKMLLDTKKDTIQ